MDRGRCFRRTLSGIAHVRAPSYGHHAYAEKSQYGVLVNHLGCTGTKVSAHLQMGAREKSLKQSCARAWRELSTLASTIPPRFIPDTTSSQRPADPD